MTRSDWARLDYNPEPDEKHLVHLIEAFLREPPADQTSWRRVLRRHPKPVGGFFSKTEIIAGFRLFHSKYEWPISENAFIALMKMKPTRTQSGVAPVTVLTKPFPCPGQCIFCPNDVRMPKSYLADEPGAQRATLNRFDPYAQTWNRLLALHRMGHSVEKVELIVLGGTWSAYPRAYQIYFVTRCFEAVNEFGRTPRPEPHHPDEGSRPDFLDLARSVPEVPAEGDTLNLYNIVVGRHLRAKHDGALLATHQTSEWARLEQAHRENQTARCRMVGLVIETRPDEIDREEVIHLRRLGATKIQIGVQSLSDDVLLKNRRGHSVQQARRAVSLLRQGGFKIHAHWMANLYGSSVELDIEDYGQLYEDPAICPDELKLYPCSLIPGTELMTHYEAGRWRPYDREELLELLCAVMPKTPPYCRLSRVIRDIPSTAIHDGNHETNFREVAEARLMKDGIVLREIRAREIKLGRVPDAEPKLSAYEYPTSVSREVFLRFEADDYL